MNFQHRKRSSTGSKFISPKFDHLLLWYPKSNSHSGTLYINSPCLSHYNPVQKAAFQVQQTVTVHEGQDYHPAIILKVGTQSEVRISEQIVEQLAEQGYTTDGILSVLKDDVELDSDDEARDETYEPPCQQTTQLASSPKSSVQSHSAIKKPCIEASPTALIQCSSASNKVSSEAAKEADLLKTFGSGTSKMTGADASRHRLHNSILGSASENVSSHKNSSSDRPVETQPDGRVPNSCPQKEPLSAAQQLLVECRMNNHLLMKSIKLQKETVQILKQAFLPDQRSNENKEDRTFTGHDGRLYHLSQLPVGITQFGREYVLRRYGEDLCATIILEPHGKTDRIAADQTVIEDIRGVLDYWYGTYSWNAVRSSINQMFRDMVNRKKHANK